MGDRLRMLAAGYTDQLTRTANVTFVASDIENGAEEDVLIGEVLVEGFPGPYALERTDALGDLIKIVDHRIFTGPTPTSGQTSLSISGNVVFSINKVRRGFSATVNVASPHFDTLQPGALAFGSWAATDAAAEGANVQGAPGDYGYDQRAIAGWTTPMFDRVTGKKYIGVTAWKAPSVADLLAHGERGIKEVWFSADGGDWLVVSEPANHPVYGNNCYLCPADSADWATSRKSEIRAIAIPWIGQPYVLQGFPDPKTETYGYPAGWTPRTNYRPDMWSMVINVDKTGTALPHGVCYIAATGGNDSNDGQSAGAPVATWERAIAVIKSTHGTTDVGGGTIYMLAGNHTIGLAAQPTLANVNRCADMPLTVTRAPGLSQSDVWVTASTGGWGLYCEKIFWLGFSKSASLNNQTPAGSYSANYFSSRTEDIYHDGGPGVDADGLTTGAYFCAVANGFNDVINCTAYRTGSAQFLKHTLLLNVVIDTVNGKLDAMASPKVCINVTCKNGADVPGGLHLDAAQYFNETVMFINEDFRTENWFGQVILIGSTNGVVEDFALIRPRLVRSGTSDLMAFGCDTPKNLYILDPQFTGSTQIWTATYDPPEIPFAIDSRMVMKADSFAGHFEADFRFGWSVIYPGMTEEPDNVDFPDPDFFGTTFGANLIDYLNADRGATVRRDLGTSDVTEVINLIQAGPAYAYIAGRPKPTYNPNGIAAGIATVEFNGVNTSTSSGSSLSKSTPPSSIRGNNPVEIFMLLNQREPAADTSSRRVTAYGGSSTSTSRDLVRAVSGGVSKADWRIGNGASPPSLAAPGDFSGVCVVHVYYNPTGQAYGVGLFNAANPTYGEDNYTRGTVTGTVNTGSSRTSIAGNTSAGGGNNGSWWEGGLNRRIVVNRVCTELERQAAIEELLSIAGLA